MAISFGYCHNEVLSAITATHFWQCSLSHRGSDHPQSGSQPHLFGSQNPLFGSAMEGSVLDCQPTPPIGVGSGSHRGSELPVESAPGVSSADR